MDSEQAGDGPGPKRSGVRLGRRGFCTGVALAMLLTAPMRLTAQVADQAAAETYPLLPVLKLGEREEFTLGEGDPGSSPEDPGVGRARGFLFKPKRSGLVTISVESVEGDAYIRVMDEEGKVLQGDDDGGVEWNPRLVVETVADQRVILDIGFKFLREGKLSVLVSEGEVPQPEGRALVEARLAFLQAQEPLLQGEDAQLALAENLNFQLERLGNLDDWAACSAVARRLFALGERLDNNQVKMLAEGRLGVALRKLGDLEAALPCLTSSVERAVSLRHAEWEMFSQGNLGMVLLDMGNPDAALRALDRAYLIASVLDDDVNGREILLRLGAVGIEYELRGAFTEAMELYQRTREAARKFGDRRAEGVSLGRMAQVNQTLGQFDVALELVDEALAVGSDASGPPIQMELQIQKAEILRGLGRLEEARSALEHSMSLTSAETPPGDQARLYACLTRLYYESGDFELALEKAQEHVTLGRRTGDERVEAVGLCNLAFLALKTGQIDRAMELSARAHELGKNGNWTEGVSILGTQVAVALAAEDVDLARSLLAEAESASANVASERLGIETASMTRSTSRWALFGEYQQDLVALQLRRLDPESPEARAVLVEGFQRIGQWRSRALLESMALRRAEGFDQFADITPEALGRMVLPAGGTLIHYVDGAENIFAYSVTGESVHFHDLGPRAVLLGGARAFLEGISNPEALATPAQVAQRGGELYARLLEPVIGRGRESRQISVVPTPSLAGLPFEALVVSASEAPRGFDEIRFVLDQHEISYAPSAPVLGLLASLGPRKTHGGGLVLADPDYSASKGGVMTAANRRLPDLPGTRNEALAIARMMVVDSRDERFEALNESRDIRVEFDGVEIALGKEASTSVLQQGLSSFAVLHFAMHGVIDEGDARRSGLVLSPGDGDDGFLSVDDIARLDIDADLAVLSACDTARGEVRRGEGVQSMARALMYAGARSVVASLWQVDDRETQRIMSAFYDVRREEGVSAPAALRTARLGVRQPSVGSQGFLGVGRGGSLGGGRRNGLSGQQLVGHPYFWAPFVYVGLPR